MVLVALLLGAGASEGASDSREVVPASEILAAIERSEPVEYDGVIVEGDLDLHTEHVVDEFGWPADIWLTWTEKAIVVKSGINIVNSEIQGNVTLVNTLFQEEVDFENTNFTKQVWFAGSNFSGYANFAVAKFSGADASFREAKFSSEVADFRGAEFSGGDAIFRGAEFSGGVADFGGAEFSGGVADFGEAEFSGGVADFGGAEFSGGYAEFWEARFSGGDAIFSDAEFSGYYAHFGGTNFSGGDADFKGAEFSGGDANFEGAKFEENANFEHSIFGNINESEPFNITLEYVRFNYDAYFEYSTFYPNTKLDLTRSSYRRMFFPWDCINQNQASPSDDDAYLALMRNYLNLGWYEDANSCYYEYRNRRRADEPIGIEKVTDTVEYALYGYGVKPFRTLGWIVGLVLAFGLVLRNGGSIKKYVREKSEVPLDDEPAAGDESEAVELKTTLRRGEIDLIDPFLFSLTTFTSGLTSFLYPAIEYEAEKHTRLVIVERLLGSVFLALLITAISKTYLIR